MRYQLLTRWTTRYNHCLSSSRYVIQIFGPIPSLFERVFLEKIKGIGSGISKRIGDILVDSAQNVRESLHAPWFRFKELNDGQLSVVRNEREKARIRDELMTLPTIG